MFEGTDYVLNTDSVCCVQTISDLLEQLVNDLCCYSECIYPHRASLKNMPGHGGNRTLLMLRVCWPLPTLLQDDNKMITTCSRLVNNWEQAVRTHLVDELRFLRAFQSKRPQVKTSPG
jgi:hypothetical protein